MNKVYAGRRPRLLNSIIYSAQKNRTGFPQRYAYRGGFLNDGGEVMIQAYKKFWKGYADFSGSTSRRDYWLAVLANFIIAAILRIFAGPAGNRGPGLWITALASVYSLAVFLPSLAIAVRRLRDAGQGWANIFWMFLPVVGSIILIVKLCSPAAPGAAVNVTHSQNSPGAPASRALQQQSPVRPAAPSGTASAAATTVFVPGQTGSSTKVPLSSLRPYHGNGVCDVCNRSLTGVKAYIVPNRTFYASPEYRKHYADLNAVFFALSGQSAEQALRHMQLNDHSEGSAVCENCIHMFAEMPTPVNDDAKEKAHTDESRKQNRNIFYVFALKGAAFGNAGGDIEAVIREKAEKLRDGYEPSKNMELSVIRPQEWGGKIEVSNQGGVISSSINIADHKQSIRNYLEKAGIAGSLIDAGIAECEKENLILTNPFSGVTVIGVPVMAEKPDAITDNTNRIIEEVEPDDENLPAHLLIRFDIEKLKELGGAYGYSAGRLLGAAIPDTLMEMMIISDGDSRATLSGEEQVYLIDISASGSSPEKLRDEIMPLIQQNDELIKYTAQPPAELCRDTSAEPLVISGVVRKGQIAGAGGLCASGLISAWKEAKSNDI